MNNLITLEFDKILQKLSNCATSTVVKKRCLSLVPALNLTEVKRRMNETTQAKKIIEQMGTPPLPIMAELQKIIDLLGVDAMLNPEQIGDVATFLMSCRRMKDYLRRAESTRTEIALYGGSIIDLSELEYEINRCIRSGQVEDRASQHLYDLRRSVENKCGQIKMKLETILKRNRECFSENFVAARNGRYTLPVKKEYKNKIEGLLVDMSNTGSTCFIEPVAVRKLQDELNELEIEEDSEVRRILYGLIALIYEELPSIKLNIEAIETLDFIFSKAKLSIDMKASPVQLLEGGDIRILSARHPLLSPSAVIPLDFALGGEQKGIVITGPNTGGKTVALKTVGLFSLMAQSGLHIPAAEGSSICIFDAVLCDIGDGQSIAESLSTFSSHMTNIIKILQMASSRSLVLLDELGSGTDPAEGMGIARAILEELLSINCLFTVTTHYPEIKDFAANTQGLVNARMAFDKESLMPLYRLEIGEAGESCALYIAERLGMSGRLIKRARDIAYMDKRAFAKSINDSGGGMIAQIETKVLEQKESKPEIMPHSQRFSIGDSVVIYPKREIGIVYAQADEKGVVGVQVKGEKLLINHKRLKLKVAASELYPDNYDFSIIFDEVENVKARHLMDRKHVEGNTVIIKKGRQSESKRL